MFLKFEERLENYESFFLPAIKTSNKICAGRPSGRLCIFWKSSLNNVNIIKYPNSSRVQSIVVGQNVVINTYFPVDPQGF